MTETTQIPVIPDGISVLNVRNVVPNSFNPNVMDDEKYRELVEDFKEKHFVEPIIVRPQSKDKYEIVDGFNRWRACKEAGLALIKAQIRTMDDDQARVYCYKINRVRGTIDPIKEAHFFGVEVEKGLTHEQIAAKYGLARNTVTERLGLLSIEEPELKAFQEAIKPTDNTKHDERANVPRGTSRPSVSQLEVLASVPKPAREAYIKQIRTEVQDYKNSPSVGLLQNEANVVKGDYEKLVKLQKIVDASQFKVCPTCGEQPKSEAYAPDILECAEYHAWNAKTGEVTTPWGKPVPAKVKADALDEQQLKEGRTKSAVFRLKVEKEEIERLLGERLRKKLPEFDTITSFDVSGTKGGKEFSMKLESWGIARGYDEGGDYDDKGRIYFTLEDKPYRTGEKTKIDAGTADSIPKVQAFLQELLGSPSVTEQPNQKMRTPKPRASRKGGSQYGIKIELAPAGSPAANEGNLFLYNFDKSFGDCSSGGGPARSREQILKAWEERRKDWAGKDDILRRVPQQPTLSNTSFSTEVESLSMADFFPEAGVGNLEARGVDQVVKESVDKLLGEEDPEDPEDPEDSDDETAMGREEA
jgi:ParB/RepB/Spo0J family partition protein